MFNVRMWATAHAPLWAAAHAVLWAKVHMVLRAKARAVLRANARAALPMAAASAMMVALLSFPAAGQALTEPVQIRGQHLEVELAPRGLGVMQAFRSLATGRDAVGGAGMLQEGFGVGSYYVPNRRVNERFEHIGRGQGGPVYQYTYDCEGPNIDGLYVTRTVEPMEDEASVRVRWRVEHRGDEELWVAPWARSELNPGGRHHPDQRVYTPSTSDGITAAERSGYHPAARNWIAVTDPGMQETVYGVFDAEDAYAFQTVHDSGAERTGFQTVFAPRIMAPGDAWETVYRLNHARGLSRVDFATDELAAQITYDNGRLEVLVAAVKAIPPAIIQATVLGANGESWPLPAMRFGTGMAPGELSRVAYDWEAPGAGSYEFLAQLAVDGTAFPLGQDTRSPHGGIDTQFTVGGASPSPLEAWTDAPHALDRGARTLQRPLAGGGSAALWFESPLNKIFPTDRIEPTGRENTVRLRSARNGRESFQLVLRAPAGERLDNVDIRVQDLLHREEDVRIPSAQVRKALPSYHPVRIASHFEGPTGLWPDALRPFQPVSAPGGRAVPVWFTVHTPPDAPAGTYVGMVETVGIEDSPIELWIELEVYDFALPQRPALVTDFGFDGDLAHAQAQAFGYQGSRDALMAQFDRLAQEARVTLRGRAALPRESADYAASLDAFRPRMAEILEQGATSVYVPRSLLEVPGQLEMANAFVREHGLEDLAFSQIANEPPQPAWSRIFDDVQTWQEHAPDIPPMVTTQGLQAFLPEALDIWSVHLQMLDTPNNRPILERTSEGGRVWWYVHHAPPRPYGNLLTDFQGMEHRILFWQAWALGMEGMHYWHVHHAPQGVNPWTNQLDITPVNGDGLLLYPSPDGPLPSIRWEIVRDGIEDYDYLTILSRRIRALREAGGSATLLEEAEAARNLQELMPDLLRFSRDPAVLEARRHEIARMIERLGEAGYE